MSIEPAAEPCSDQDWAVRLSRTIAPVTHSSGWEDVSHDVYDVMVSVHPPDDGYRTASDIVAVVDVSGSMGVEATVQNEKGDSERHGLSLLDVVKHAVRTIIRVLGPEDRFALVAYSTQARLVYDLTRMDESGKAAADAQLEELRADGQTNLWDGLHTALETLLHKPRDGRLAHVMLLTDGLPNICPPRGNLPMLKRYRDTKTPEKKLPCTISTFGFGYTLDSDLLKDLAIMGNGSYAFIPDAGFVGTVFVNAIANLLVTVAQEVYLSLTPGPDSKIVQTFGGHPVADGLLQLGTLQYGQRRDVVVRLSVPGGSRITEETCSAILKYERMSSEGKMDCQSQPTDTGAIAREEVEPQRIRLATVDAIRNAMLKVGKVSLAGEEALAGGMTHIQEFVKEIQASPAAQATSVKDLLEDLEGQVTEALSKIEYYKKWGVHYLPSLMCAHLMQQCNNFKDPGVQDYGGTLFRNVCDEAHDLFMDIPPPKPTAVVPEATTAVAPAAGYGAQPVAPVVDMQRYYNVGGGCFCGESLILMGDYSRKRASELTKGDQIALNGGGSASVQCLVKTRCDAGLAPLVDVDGLLITAYHPVRIGGNWVFPKDYVGPAELRPCKEVCSVLLSAGHILDAGGVEVIGLGHGFEDEVAAHPYFGSFSKVLEDLSHFPGYDQGVVELTPRAWQRDPHTGLICGLDAAVHTKRQALICK